MAFLRWRDLEETVNKNLGADNPLTSLVPNLEGSSKNFGIVKN